MRLVSRSQLTRHNYAQFRSHKQCTSLKLLTLLSMVPVFLLLLAVCLVTIPAAAQTWTQQNPSTSPPARDATGMAFDAANGNVVLFGGNNPDRVSQYSDTWTWDGTTWTQKFPATSPPAQSYHSLVYDEAYRYVLLFGALPNTDTWTWDGTDWTQHVSANSPPPRMFGALTYDASHGNVVLYGGYGNGWLSDTWIWDGNDWTQVTNANTPCVPAVSSYDSVRGNVVLFDDCAKTWIWDGAKWTVRSPATSPPFREYTSMIFDAGIGEAVLYGGSTYAGPPYFDDTWTWDGTTWTQQINSGNPPAREFPGFAYDPIRGNDVLFSGYNNSFLSDTWTFGAPMPYLTSPTASPLSGLTQFTWNPGQGTTQFELTVGTGGAGTSDLYDSGIVANTVTSESVTFPPDGKTLYVRLSYEITGTWSYIDYTFTEALPPSLTSPSASPLSGSTQFTWNPGVGSAEFLFRVGTVGPDAHDLYMSGYLPNTVTSETVSIPSDGVTLYVRLFYRMNGTWSYKDYTFTEAGASTAPWLTSPTASPLSGSTQFTWNPGVGAAEFQLRMGTVGPDAHEIYNSGVLANTLTSETVSIPSDGVTLYVRLFYRMNGTWSYKDYTFTEAGTPTAPWLTSPTASPLSGSTQFIWDPGVGASEFLFRVGTAGPNSHDIYMSGYLPNTVSSETINIPSNGVTVYVRLSYLMSGVWSHKDYTFTEAP